MQRLENILNQIVELNISYSKIEVSVVIPTYNSGETLIRAIDSVFSQSLNTLIEVIVVDDGSTDETQLLIEKYHHPVKYLYQSNNGVASARNKGIRESKGLYIAFLDADDEWHPSKLEKQINIFNNNPKIHFVSTGMVDIYQNDEVRPSFHPSLAGDLFTRLIFYNPVCTSSVLIKKRVFNDLSLRFDDVTNVGEDWLLWIRISARYKIVTIPNILVNRFLLPGSLENKEYNKGQRKNIYGIYQNLKKDAVVMQKLEKNRIGEEIFTRFHKASILHYEGSYFEAFLAIVVILKYLPIYLIFRQLIKFFIPSYIYKNAKVIQDKLYVLR
jgi:glycosyltransferase involved in cell wall biosynthesis